MSQLSRAARTRWLGLTRTARRAAFQASSRSGKAAMTSRRSVGVMRLHPAISNRVRPQPVQMPAFSSNWQTWMQGLSITVMAEAWESGTYGGVI